MNSRILQGSFTMTNAPKIEMLIDCHAHLDQVVRIDHAIQNALATNVKRIVAVGMDIETNVKTLNLYKKHTEVIYPAIGYHPWSIRKNEIEKTLAFLEESIHQCIAIGEIGLDYKIKMKKATQHDVFSQLLDLADKKKKPVIVHSRFSHERCYRMVSSACVEKAVFHWYSGPLDILERIIKDGYYVSATPALAYSPAHQAAIEMAPLERILIETDTPVVYQGEVSEPAHLLKTLTELSRLKGMTLVELARITTANARRFFGI